MGKLQANEVNQDDKRQIVTMSRVASEGSFGESQYIGGEGIQSKFS